MLKRHKAITNIVINLIMILIILLLFLIEKSSLYFWIVLSAIFIIVNLLLWFSYEKRFLDFFLIFLVFFVLFTFGSFIPSIYKFKVFLPNYITNYFSTIQIIRILFMIDLSFIFINIGGHLSKIKSKRLRKNSVVETKNEMFLIKIFGITILLISIVPTFIDIIESIRFVNIYGYGASLYKEHLSTNVSFTMSLKTLFPYSMFYLVIAYSKSKSLSKVFLISILLYALLILFIGQRFSSISLIIGALLLYDLSVERIINYKKLLYFSIFIFIITIPVLSQLRLLARVEWTFELFINGILSVNNYDKFFFEIGNSIIPLFNTVFSGIFNEMEGSTYFTTILYSIVPSDILQLFKISNENAMLQLNYTKIINPGIYELGGGLGFSMIAEAYINSELFYPVYLVIFGFIYESFFDLSKELVEARKYIFVPIMIYLLQRVLFYVRSDLFDFYGNFKLSFYIFLMLYISKEMINKTLIRRTVYNDILK